MRKIDVIIILALVILTVLSFNKYFLKDKPVLRDPTYGLESIYPESNETSRDFEKRIRE